MTDNTVKEIVRAVLVSADTGEFDAERSLDELEELSRTAGVEVAARVTQKRPAQDSATVIGTERELDYLMLLPEGAYTLYFTITDRPTGVF